jgi:hypothetical protein
LAVTLLFLLGICNADELAFRIHAQRRHTSSRTLSVRGAPNPRVLRASEVR